MHFSAKSLVGESMQYPELYYRNNVIGTLNLLEAMAKHGVKYFIFSSSTAVYGIPGYSPIDEAHPTVPINPYGRTKLLWSIPGQFAAGADGKRPRYYRCN